MMERCASILAFENLPRRARRPSASRSASSTWRGGGGARLHRHARLREVVDERKLRFDVEVREGERTIGVGTHERRVVDRAGFGS